MPCVLGLPSRQRSQIGVGTARSVARAALSAASSSAVGSGDAWACGDASISPPRGGFTLGGRLRIRMATSCLSARRVETEVSCERVDELRRTLTDERDGAPRWSTTGHGFTSAASHGSVGCSTSCDIASHEHLAAGHRICTDVSTAHFHRTLPPQTGTRLEHAWGTPGLDRRPDPRTTTARENFRLHRALPHRRTPRPLRPEK